MKTFPNAAPVEFCAVSGIGAGIGPPDIACRVIASLRVFFIALRMVADEAMAFGQGASVDNRTYDRETHGIKSTCSCNSCL